LAFAQAIHFRAGLSPPTCATTLAPSFFDIAGSGGSGCVSVGRTIT
jgi:hypothetical protein